MITKSSPATTKHKSSDVRRRELELAISRILRGRSHTKVDAQSISISAVAREAGVSPALIHNHYPEIADKVREHQGRSCRAYRDAKHDELKIERDKSRALRGELKKQQSLVAKLASINEVLVHENRALRAKSDASNVSEIGSRDGT